MVTTSALLRPRIVYAVIAAVTIACHWNGLDAPWFIYDDAKLIQPEVWTGWEDPSGLLRIWTHDRPFTPHYRPIVDSLLWFGQRLWGELELGYRLFNLALHQGAVFWAIALFRRMRIPHAKLVGLVIAIHPLAVQPVMRMAESRVLLCDLFVIGATWSLVRQHLEQSWRWGVLGLVLFALAMLSKSTAVSLPPMLLVLIVLFRIRPTRQTWLFIAASIALAIAIGLLDWYRTVDVLGFTSPPSRTTMTFVSSMQYLKNLLIPYPLGWLYDPRIEPLEWICAGIVLASFVAMAATKRWQQLRVLVLVLVLVFVSVAPAMVGHVTWMWSPAQDRYQHLSLFVLVPYLAHVLASVVGSGVRTRRAVVIAVAALVVVFVVTTFRVAWTYGTADRFFMMAARTAPRSPHPAIHWAENLERQGQFKTARWVLTKNASIIQEEGLFAVVRQRIAWLYLQTGDYDDVLQLLPPPRTYWGDSLVAAIKLECPDPGFRDPEAGTAIVNALFVRFQVDEIVMFGRERAAGEQFLRPHLDVLMASVAASSGRFDDADRWIARALAAPALHGRGTFRARLRAHLLERQRSYRAGIIVEDPGSQVLWRTPPWVR